MKIKKFFSIEALGIFLVCFVILAVVAANSGLLTKKRGPASAASAAPTYDKTAIANLRKLLSPRLAEALPSAHCPDCTDDSGCSNMNCGKCIDGECKSETCSSKPGDCKPKSSTCECWECDADQDPNGELDSCKCQISGKCPTCPNPNFASGKPGVCHTNAAGTKCPTSCADGAPKCSDGKCPSCQLKNGQPGLQCPSCPDKGCPKCLNVLTNTYECSLNSCGEGFDPCAMPCDPNDKSNCGQNYGECQKTASFIVTAWVLEPGWFVDESTSPAVVRFRARYEGVCSISYVKGGGNCTAGFDCPFPYPDGKDIYMGGSLDMTCPPINYPPDEAYWDSCIDSFLENGVCKSEPVVKIPCTGC